MGIQPDTIVPDPSNPQAYNRYSYVYGNPLRYIDPSGHDPRCGPDGIFCGNEDWVNPQYPSRGYLLGPLWNNNSGSASSGGGGNSNSGSSGGEIVSLLPEGPTCTINFCGQQNSLSAPTGVIWG